MTTQMRKIIKAIFYITLATNIAFVAIFFVDSIGFYSWISYVSFGLNVATSITLGIIIAKDSKIERLYLKQVKAAKALMDRRNDILMGFYKRYNIPPQYDKNGNLRDLDSLLGLVQEYDQNGKLLPTIYDILGIQPIFDKSGKEVPIVLVIKHVIDKFRSKDLDNFKGMVFVRKPDENELKKLDDNSKVKKLAKVAKLKKEAKKDDKSNSKSKAASLPPFVKGAPNKTEYKGLVSFESGSKGGAAKSEPGTLPNNNMVVQAPKNSIGRMILPKGINPEDLEIIKRKVPTSSATNSNEEEDSNIIPVFDNFS